MCLSVQPPLNPGLDGHHGGETDHRHGSTCRGLCPTNGGQLSAVTEQVGMGTRESFW